MKVHRVLLIAVVCVPLVTAAYHVTLPTHRKLETLDSTLFENSDVKLVRAGEIDRLHVLHTQGNRLYAVDDHVLYASDDGEHFKQVGRLTKDDPGALERLADRIARTKLVRAIRRNNSVGHVLVLQSGTILVFYDRVYRSSDGGRTFETVYEGQEQPFAGVVATPDDLVYFGEYVTSARPHPVRILRGSDDGRTWSVAHTFPSGDIFHVHSMRYDPYRRWIIVATGDRNEESRVLYTADDFRSVNVLGGGSQEWRVVSLIPTEDALIWGSDDDVNGAAIFRYDLASRTLERLQETGKPSYFAERLGDGTLVVSTAYEPRSPYTKRHHPSPTTDLWISRDGRRWTKVLEVDGRAEMMEWGPARPTMRLLAKPGDDPLLFVNPRYTKRHDFVALLLKIHWK